MFYPLCTSKSISGFLSSAQTVMLHSWHDSLYHIDNSLLLAGRLKTSYILFSFHNPWPRKYCIPHLGVSNGSVNKAFLLQAINKETKPIDYSLLLFGRSLARTPMFYPLCTFKSISGFLNSAQAVMLHSWHDSLYHIDNSLLLARRLKTGYILFSFHNPWPRKYCKGCFLHMLKSYCHLFLPCSAVA
jgi:hypothetical protein